MVVRRNKHAWYIIFASKRENFNFYWASIGVDKNDRPQCLDLTAIIILPAALWFKVNLAIRFAPPNYSTPFLKILLFSLINEQILSKKIFLFPLDNWL